MLDCVKVTFDNGDVIFSDFNAEVGREEIARYYMGKTFNLGSVKDDMHKVVKVEFDFEKKKKKMVEACKICDNRCNYCKFACNCSTLVEVTE